MREAARNFLARGISGAIWIGFAALILGTVCLAELAALDRIKRFEAERVAQGAYVRVVTSEDGLAAARCDSIRANPAVIGAGGLSEGEILTLRSAPGLLFQSGTVTPGGLEVLGVGHPEVLAHQGWVLGQAAADEIRAGRGWTIDGGQVREPVIAVISFAARDPAINRWMLDVRAPVGQVDECWVEFDRSGASVGADFLAAWFDGELELEIRPVLADDTLARNPDMEFGTRTEQHAWVLAAAALALAVAAVMLSRRREIALYRALGLPRSLALVLFGAECLLMIGTAWVLGTLLAIALLPLSGGALTPHEVVLGAGSSASAALLASLTLPAAIAIAARSSIADAIKDAP